MRKMRRARPAMPPTTPPAIAPTGVEDDAEEDGGDEGVGDVDSDAVEDCEEPGGVEDGEVAIEDGVGEEDDVDAIVAGSMV